MIYKCEICGFETASPAQFIEHLEKHFSDALQEIARLRVELNQVVEANRQEVSIIDSEKKVEKKVEKTKKSEPKGKRTRQSFDNKILEILGQYAETESPKQIQERILSETGKTVRISSIYNWKYKNRINNNRLNRLANY